MANRSDARVQVHARPDAGPKFRAAIFEGVTELAVFDVWPAAVRLSPVAKGKMHGGRYVGGGGNRRSITVEVVGYGEPGQIVGGEGTNRQGVPFDKNGGVALIIPTGVSVAVFTQSGYGGYLEVGTRFMGARPYIGPAWEQNWHKLPDYVRAKYEATT